MGRFEWLTPERVMHTWGLAAVLGAFAVALMFVYLGFLAPTAFRLFGVNGFFLLAGLQLLIGVGWLIHEYSLRPPVP